MKNRVPLSASLPYLPLRPLRLCVIFLFLAFAVAAQTIPAPSDTLGFTPGDDRKLASWTQIVEYFNKLDAASDRMTFQEIGKTTMGAPFVFATISSPENLKTIKKYELINAKLADPRKLTGGQALARDAAAKALIKQGKTIVLITCGVHSTEVGSTLSSMLIAHRLASSNEPEIQNILKNTIILLVPSLNPDGVDIVKNWYDKTLGTKFEGTEPPELYHKYVGHDNNRDWYAFTQIETQLTVDKIHNVWHPQIVHDIHQQGANGARLFLPPYMAPVEPNVPKQIVEGYTELGNWMAADLRKRGLEGITTNTTYDAWTPARAYSHYHGGVRILSETASARLATPIDIKFENLRGDVGGFDSKVASDKFGPVWKGGEWKLRNITDYMTTAAFSLLNHAADNRGKWLARFYEIGKEAVRPRKDGELRGFKLSNIELHEKELLSILDRAGVAYYHRFGEGKTDTATYTPRYYIVPVDQPYGGFAKALFENQVYPELKDASGNPITPYDVTAHTVSLLMNLKVENLSSALPVNKRQKHSRSEFPPFGTPFSPDTIFRSHNPSMDEGWTRWVFEEADKGYFSINARDISKHLEYTSSAGPIGPGDHDYTLNKIFCRSIIFPDQSSAQILNGYAKGSMPDEYTGGVGKEGVENLRKFVEAGGTLVFLNRSSNFAIEQFNLPVRDVTRGLARKDFYIPGSILRTELNTTHPIAKGMPQQSIAWFENSPAFEIAQDARVEVIARYPSDPKNVLLSGWALGAEKIAGKAALVSIPMGKGKIVLFGFRPQYRGQSLATFPLLFNAISQ